MRRIMFTECHSPLWLDLARRLRAEHGLQPCYWVGKRVFEPAVHRTFPEAVFHARTDAIRGIPPAALRDLTQCPLDAAFFTDYASMSITAGKMMDRLDPGNGFRYEERMRLFETQARYWRSVVAHFQPWVVLFPVQPHTVYDYILYEICQREGVKTVMFQWTLFTDWILPIDHIDHGYAELTRRTRERERAPESFDLHPRVSEYVRKGTSTYEEAIPPYLVRQMPTQLRQQLFRRRGGDPGAALFERPALQGGPPPDAAPSDRPARERERPLRMSDLWPPRRASRVIRKRARHRLHRIVRGARDTAHRLRRVARQTIKRVGQWIEHAGHALRPRRLRRWWRNVAAAPGRARKRAWAFYKRWFRHLVYALRYGDVDRPLKEHGRPFELSYRGRTGAIRLQWNRLRGRIAKRQMFRYYTERCGVVEDGVPYVFVALHYQPEQTTCPTGGVFMDQLLMVQLLSRLVPAGWRVLVKEHPYQFFAGSVGERGRSLDFYDDLAGLSNVTLVPWSISPFELIDRSQAVANVTGTTGLEALLRGKPVFAFGYAWYRSCAGVFYTPTAEALAAALAQVVDGYQVDASKVRAFLKAVEDVSLRADLDFGEKITPIPHEQNVDAVLSGFLRRLPMTAPLPVSID